MEQSNRKTGYFSYFKSCFDTIKSAITDYRSYSSRYDRYQMQCNAIELDYNPCHNGQVNQQMERLLKTRVPRKKCIKTLTTNIAENIKHTITYGTFAVISFLWTDQKSIDEIIYRPRTSRTKPETNLTKATEKLTFDDTWGFVNDNLTI